MCNVMADEIKQAHLYKKGNVHTQCREALEEALYSVVYSVICIIYKQGANNNK